MEFRVMIVDDEPEIAEGISFLIGKYCRDCRTVGIGYDGEDGFRKILSVHPDIVLTDVRMPGCDGLEMIRRLRQENIQARFVILTGYAEFEYARKAVSLGVSEFLTKPVEETELKQVMETLCGRIREERDHRESIETMQDTMQNYLLRDFLNGADCDMDQVRRILKQKGLLKEGSMYSCLLLETEGRGDTDWWGEWQEEIGKNINGKAVFLNVSGNLTAAMLQMRGKADMAGLRRCITGLMGSSAGKDAVLNAGIGRCFRTAENLPKSLEEAKCALNYKLIQGDGSVIFYEKISDIQGKSELIYPEEIHRLEEAIQKLDNGGIKETVETVFERLAKVPDLSMEDLQFLSLNLVLSGIRKIPFAQLQINRYLGKNIFSLESIAKFRTMEQLRNWIVNTLSGINELMLKENLPEKRDMIQEAKDYILKNYNKEISLNDISREFYINPYYFSQLFKKRTGTTYQKYLMDLRVERARRLLEETDLKIYEVCEMVGYADVNHFNRIFERSVGMKPGEYRKWRTSHICPER